ALLSVLALAALATQPATAQQIPPGLLRRLQQSGTDASGLPGLAGLSGLSGGQTPNEQPSVQTYQPVAPNETPPSSLLEKVYELRVGQHLSQFGYGALGVPAAVSIVQSGAVQDSYILGIGDELTFELRGQENSSYRQTVDRDGRIVLPNIDPIMAAGRTFGQFRAALESAIRRSYVSTKVFVSLDNIRQVSVFVGGNVRTPGMRIVGGLASPLDAILLSGGISKSGSLRNVRLIRNGVVRTLDLYRLLLAAPPLDLGTLQEGDRIIVPPLGNTVAVTGSVTRPGIFELPSGTSATTAAALLKLAGGTLIANVYGLSKMEIEPNGVMRLVPVSAGTVVRSGEVLFVIPSRSEYLDHVSIDGAVQIQGSRPISLARSTRDLFHSIGELSSTAYAPFALIVRRNRTSNALSLLPFSVTAALDGTSVVPLQSGDAVYVFTTEDMSALARFVTKDMNAPYDATNVGGRSAPAPQK